MLILVLPPSRFFFPLLESLLFTPRRYDLTWDPKSQYGMTVIYGMAGADQNEGEVFMAARLGARIDLAEIEVARQLIRAYTLRHSNDEAGRIRFQELE